MPLLHSGGGKTGARKGCRGVLRRSVIIPPFASKSLFIMLLGELRLRRASLFLCVLLSATLALVSCGSSSSSNQNMTSGLKFRALVSQDVSSGTVLGAGLIIVNAEKDARAPVAPISLASFSAFFPGMMVVSDNRQITLAVSNPTNQIGIFSNSQEKSIAGVNLSGPTDSVVISTDALTGYAAVPAAPVPAGNPGGIAVFSTSNGAVTATVPIQSVRYLARSGDTSRLLAFSDNSDTITIVPTASILPGQGQNTPLITVSGFDRPIAGFFSSDGSMAWIVNCGPECGGTEASVQELDLIHNTPGRKAVVSASTVGFINNETMYVAGTPQAGANDCSGVTTAATTCGRLSIVDLPSMTVIGPGSPQNVIADGFHTQLALGPNGQLFVGSTHCTNIELPPAPATGEQRGCLNIYDTVHNTTINPPDNGDVTGLQPITNRTIMYVIEGGELRIYDTTTDKISVQNNDASIDVFGNAVDVKLIDF